MANLVELFDNIVQMQNLNGVPLAAGKLYVYALGRTRLMNTWSDVDGESLNPNPIILDDAGQAHVYVSDDFDYTLVVCDQYNNEIFSLDKYLYSKSSHSHADVAVAPSESIAVSSYHVGECTVYVPYLTGQLGKVYEGIDPIVVNNQVDKISANHVPLGVQDPLYFVQDDEEGCIIGCSAQTEIPSALSSKWDEASDAVITNSAQWAEGTEYEAGTYVDITNNTISVTGLTPVPADTASTGLVASVSADITAMIPDTSDMATQTWVNEQGFLTAIPSEYVTENTLQSGLSSKLDSTAFSTVSGDFLTAHQSLDGLMSADLLEISDNKITGYNGTAFAGQGGGVTGDYELSAGSGISIVDYPLEQKTVISVSGDYATNTQLQTVSGDITAMIPTGDYLTKDSADTIYQPIGDYLSSNALEGYATENWVTSQGYITTETDWTNTITAASANAYNEATAAIPTGLATTGDLANVSADITAQIPTDLFTKASADTLYQPIGNYLTTGDSANFATTGDVEDLITSISETYQTTAGMTAYLTTGDSAEFMTTAERSDYIPTGVSSEFYTTANTAGYISTIPDTYLQNTDLSTTDGKVTAISGIPLSAGGDVPEGVMVESGLEYNAVNEISGYNGSAIAQYGAEKQWLQHDDTIVHVSNSAQYAFGVNLSAVAQLLGVDETVLYENSAGAQCSANAKLVFSENPFNFTKIKVYGGREPASRHSVQCHEFLCNSNYTNIEFNTIIEGAGTQQLLMYHSKGTLVNSGIDWNASGTICKTFETDVKSTTASPQSIIRVIGIGRKS